MKMIQNICNSTLIDLTKIRANKRKLDDIHNIEKYFNVKMC